MMLLLLISRRAIMSMLLIVHYLYVDFTVEFNNYVDSYYIIPL